MEIEAKFVVPNNHSLSELKRARKLAGFRLAPKPTVTVQDQYLDTAGRRLFAAGYFCRLRSERSEHRGRSRQGAGGDGRTQGEQGQGAAIIVTLKSLGGAEGAVHHRDEHEVRLSEWQPDPAAWPESPARDLALRLAGGDRLEPWFQLTQVRAKREIRDGRRAVAELSLDKVKMVATRRRRTYYELEAELLATGTEQDLVALAAELGERMGLAAERRSKFERAVEALQQPKAPRDRPSPDEQAILEAHARGNNSQAARRARAVLAWAEGLPASEIAGRSGLSVVRSGYWVRAFRAGRLAIFRTPAPASSAPEPAAPDASDGAADSQPTDQTNQPTGQLTSNFQSPTSSEPTNQPPPLSPSDPMSEAGRKVFCLHFGKMQDNEKGARSGEDEDAVHDMRVATRRLRAAFQVFEPYFSDGTLKPFQKKLRTIAHKLGAVRDLDVLLSKAKRHQEKLSPEQAGGLEPLLAAWRSRRDDEMLDLVAYLDGDAYRKFVGEFAGFLDTPEAGAPRRKERQPVAFRVCQVVPRLLMTRYENVRAYEPLMADGALDTYHQLRIEFKRLRYALEFFRDVLGPQAPELIKQVVGLQDLLGDVQDSSVAEGLIAEFLHEQIQRRRSEPEQTALDGVAGYLAEQWKTQRELLGRFPSLWADLLGYDFRRDLGLAAAAL